jgi:hypothetical protein
MFSLNKLSTKKGSRDLNLFSCIFSIFWILKMFRLEKVVLQEVTFFKDNSRDFKNIVI